MNLLPKTPQTSNTEARRIPINVDHSSSEPIEPGSNLFPIVLVFLVLISGIGAGWYLYKPQTTALAESRPKPTSTANILEANFETPNILRAGEAFPVTVNVKNNSSIEQIVHFEIQNQTLWRLYNTEELIIEAGSEASAALQIMALEPGAWTLDLKISTGTGSEVSLTRALTVRESELSAWLDLGDTATFIVPRNRRIYGVIRWRTHEPVYLPRISLRTDARSLINSRDGLIISLKLGNYLSSNQHAGRSVYFTLNKNVLPGTAFSYRDLRLFLEEDFEIKENGERVVHRIKDNVDPNQLLVSAFARAYDSKGKLITQIPIPPRAGTTSTYWLNLSLDRQTRALENTSVVVALPPWARPTGRTFMTRQDSLDIDATTRILTWRRAKPLPRDGRDFAPLVGIEIEYTPQTSEIGRFPNIGSLEATAKNERISRHLVASSRATFKASTITGDLELDKFCKENGVVRGD